MIINLGFQQFTPLMNTARKRTIQNRIEKINFYYIENTRRLNSMVRQIKYIGAIGHVYYSVIADYY